MKLGLIGATGWLGSALGKGLLEKGIVAPGDFTLLNRSGPPSDYHGYSDVFWAKDVPELVQRSEIIVLSVRPQDWRGLQLAAPGKLVLSFMAGVPCAELQRCGGRIVRAMPNAAAEMGASYSPWFAAEGVTVDDRDVVSRVLSGFGTSDPLDREDHIDLMTAVPGSGAAYPSLLAQAMLTYLRDHGLPEQIARKSVEAAVCDGARMLEGRVESAATYLDAYLDYNGTTAAGLRAASAAGFEAAVSAALDAAIRASRDLLGPEENY